MLLKNCYIVESLLKAISAKHRSKFAALSPVMVAAARLAEKSLCCNKQSNLKKKTTKKKNLL
jgi:hypothetical protein